MKRSIQIKASFDVMEMTSHVMVAIFAIFVISQRCYKIIISKSKDLFFSLNDIDPKLLCKSYNHIVLYICLYVNIYNIYNIYIYTHIYIHIHIYVYIYVYIYMYIYIYIHIYIYMKILVEDTPNSTRWVVDLWFY